MMQVAAPMPRLPPVTRRTGRVMAGSCRCVEEAPDNTKRAALASRPSAYRMIRKRSALRELEAAAGLGLTELLTLDDTRVAGQEAFLLERAAKLRLVEGQRLGDAVAHRARLAGETAALDRDDDVVLRHAIDELQRLLEHEAQHRAGEIDLLITAVDRDLAGARLDPDARDGVLALAGGIGTALRIDLLDVDRSGRLIGLGDIAELGEGLKNLGHGQ